MSIPIYKQEINDGLGDQIRAAASIAITSSPRVGSPTNEQKERFAAIAKANPNQFDLFYLESVLVSTGWNKNDDVFDRFETWRARSTPVDKQFNYMHNEKDIIGHITSAVVIGFDGKVIDENVAFDDVPSNFEIVVGSVLYRMWSDENLNKRMNEIIAEIANGKWFVSMECLFRNFDYAMVTPNGENKVIARNEDSSFLTKYLRIYGGPGEYEGHKVGRLLRDFGFSGKGLVDKPANPRSFILNFDSKQETSSFAGLIENISNIKGELLMANEVVETVSKAQYDELKKELEATKAKELNELQEKITKLEESYSKLNDEFKASKEILNVKDEKIVGLEKELAETRKSLDETKAEITKMNLEAIKAGRLSKLLTKDIDEVKANDLVSKFTNASDEMFDALLNSLPEKKSESKCDEDMEDEEDEDKKTKGETENLDKVETKVEPDLNVTNDETNSVASKAAAWLQEKILSTTANKKK